MGERDEFNETEFGLKRDHRAIQNRPCGTHPGAEHGAMCGSLMMGMVPGMLDRLRLSQSANNKHAEHQQNCECSFCMDAVHLSSPQTQPRGADITGVWKGESRGIKPVAVFGEVLPCPVLYCPT